VRWSIASIVPTGSGVTTQSAHEASSPAITAEGVTISSQPPDRDCPITLLRMRSYERAMCLTIPYPAISRRCSARRDDEERERRAGKRCAGENQELTGIGPTAELWWIVGSSECHRADHPSFSTPVRER
jgi:hypothetical protein